MRLRPADCQNLAGTETGRRHLSHTQLSTFLNCEKRYEWRYVHHLVPDQPPLPLGLGKAYALAVEMHDPAAGARAYRAEQRILSQEDEDRVRVDEAIVEEAARAYLERWGSGGGLREFEYRVRLRNPWTGHYSRTFDLLGYADGIYDHGSHVELIENKLVSQITQVSIRRLPLDRQIALAAYGIWRATGKTVDVVSYRFVRKPTIRPRKGESIDEFIERLRQDYADRRDFYTHEESWHRTSDDLLLCEAELWRYAEQIRSSRHREFFPRNTSHCVDFGGCPYLPLCVGDADAISLYRCTREHVEEAA